MKINGKEIDLDLTDLRVLRNIEEAKAHVMLRKTR